MIRGDGRGRSGERERKQRGGGEQRGGREEPERVRGEEAERGGGLGW